MTISTTPTGFACEAIAFFFFFGFLSSALADEVVVDLTADEFNKNVGGSNHALIAFYTPGCANCKRLEPEYELFAENCKKEKYVLVGKFNCKKYKSTCEKFKLTGLPTIRWFSRGTLEAKEYIGKPTAEGLAEFVNHFGGTHVKIITPPSSIVVLSADNFNKIVMDETKDVLVEFYAPWCGHCTTLAPIYEKLATAYKLEENIVIANIDADKYKIVATKYGVSSYPTLKLFPKNNKMGEDYSGDQELTDFVEFINEKCGSNRDPMGRLTAKAGIIESLDYLVKKFINATGDEKKMVYSMMKEEVDKLNDSSARHGKIYLKAAKSSMDKGPEYPKNELERITRIASKPISEEKADEFALKKNILSTFA